MQRSNQLSNNDVQTEVWYGLEKVLNNLIKNLF